jgi:hypothetical protein
MLLVGVSAPFSLVLGEPHPVVEVVVFPRSNCADGIDNNGNGSVDTDDTACIKGGPGELPKSRTIESVNHPM